MPDARTIDALFRAVIDAPDNLLPRLALADALDERGGPGDAERAEFIRVQCEVFDFGGTGARICDAGPCRPVLESDYLCTSARPPCSDCRSHMKRFHEIRDRERELWGSWPDADDMRHAVRREIPLIHDWTILPDSMRADLGNVTPSSVVRCGFPEDVRLPVAAWLADGPKLVRAAPLRRVVLSDRRPSQWSAGAEGNHREWAWERSMSDQPNPESFTYLGSGPYADVADDDAAIVPPAIFDLMTGESGGLYFKIGKHSHRRYRTESEANDALSQACIAWAKTAG